jgi:carboxyl-terminal processing protease
MASSRRRNYLVVPAFIVAGSIAATIFGGGGALAAPADDAVNQSLKSFTEVFNLVEENFADPVKADRAVYNGAIPGMLRTLDPHSSFFDPKAYQSMRDDQRGRYYGVGMTVGQREGKVIVMAPFGGSPAYRAGLRPGDVILEVNGHKTDGLGTPEVADLLRGPRGTKVTVMVGREGNEQPITVSLVRDEIPRPSVPLAFFIRPGIAYVQITSFGETTGRELEEKMKKLNERDVRGLILDLRGNPGGLLNEGVDVAGHFLRRGEIVVSHRGRSTASPNKNYQTRADGSGKDYPVVVLVNRSSASAAEIVTGALQDHDRGWVLGEPTFGKGLVQTVFPLSENTALALTTAHYYTPSGRLIQRDYSTISFLDYYTQKRKENKNTSDVKMTDSGRTVYGGGGITPDEKFEAPTLNKFQAEVKVRRYAFFTFAAKYFGARDAKLPKGWEPDEELVNQFHAYLLKEGVDFTEGEFTANHQWIKEELKREFYITAFSLEDSNRVAAEQDPAVMKAIDSLPKAKALLETAKKLIVERRQQQQGGAQQAQVRR